MDGLRWPGLSVIAALAIRTVPQLAFQNANTPIILPARTVSMTGPRGGRCT